MRENLLLLLACSNLKNQSKILMPAIERYDGGSYKIIRKMRRENIYSSNIDVKIISAKFGLIDSQTPIPLYDEKMNSPRAKQLESQIKAELNKVFLQKNYTEMYVDLGQQYLATIKGLILPTEINLTIAKGRIGERLSKLKEWLLSCNQI